MADSLRDQLVKSGLAKASQARKAERQSRAEKNTKRQGGKKGKSPEGANNDPDSPAIVRERARKQKAERDRAIARVANEKSAAKALRAEITQIIRQNDQRVKTTKDDDVPYNFAHGKKVKRIYVQEAQRDQLSTGRLVIINNNGNYHLVPAKVAAQISERDPSRIIAAHGATASDSAEQKPTDDDDHYAKFEVPDDLDW